MKFFSILCLNKENESRGTNCSSLQKRPCFTLKGKTAVTLRYQSGGEIAFHHRDKGRRRWEREGGGEGGRREELGGETLADRPIRSTSPGVRPPFYSSEWGAPPHFSSLPGGVCVDRAVQWISGHVIGNVRDTNLTKCPG